MFKKISVLVVMLITACAVETNPNFKDSSDALVEDEILWVCYSPGMPQHGKQCVEEAAADQCLFPGDQGRFCWRLRLRDCKTDAGLLYNEICNEIN